MTDLELREYVADLNSFLNSKPWLDIDVIQCSSHSAVLHCGIDLTEGPEIEIKFDSIFFVSFLMSWKTDTSRPVLEILTGKDAVRVNMLYQIEQGHHLFAFSPEYLEGDTRFVIAARSISWRKIKEC